MSVDDGAMLLLAPPRISCYSHGAIASILILVTIGHRRVLGAAGQLAVLPETGCIAYAVRRLLLPNPLPFASSPMLACLLACWLSIALVVMAR